MYFETYQIIFPTTNLIVRPTGPNGCVFLVLKGPPIRNIFQRPPTRVCQRISFRI